MIEKLFVPANLLEAMGKRGTKVTVCIRSRLGKKVPSVVRGLMPTVIKHRRTLSHSLGGARNGEPDCLVPNGVGERQIAR